MAADRPNQYPCSPSAEQGSRKVFGMRYVHLHRPGFVAPPNSSQTAPYMVKSATDTATNIPSSLKMDFFHTLLKPHQSPSQNRSEEHTSELQSLMRISYAAFCLNKNNTYT